jgi:hypothetical protein
MGVGLLHHANRKQFPNIFKVLFLGLVMLETFLARGLQIFRFTKILTAPSELSVEGKARDEIRFSLDD